MKKNIPDNSVLYITGGGGLSTSALNISTLSAIILSAAGLKIIKHVSTNSCKKCSSSAFLKQMNIKISYDSFEAEKNFDKYGIVFLEAESEFAAKNLCPFITLGHEVKHLIGLNSAQNAMKYLFDLRTNGCKRAIVISPADNAFDEVCIHCSTQVFELKDGIISNYVISPQQFGIKPEESIIATGATPLYNANLSVDIMSGNMHGAKIDLIALNVGVMLYTNESVSNIQNGIIEAYKLLKHKNVLEKLNALRS